MFPKLTELVPIPAGSSWLGSNDFYPEEAPRRRVDVAAFQLERHPVTNEQFARFVAETGWVSTAERPIPDDVVGIPDALRAPGSLVFSPTDGPVDLLRWELWWRWVPGASWRQPHGPASNITANAEHPYAWDAEFLPDGQLMANTFQGDFPYRNTGANGWFGTSPVATFPLTQHGLVDMIGNVWEWTATRFRTQHQPGPSCCASSEPATTETQFVVKGGSHLCNPAYCARYRPAARQPPNSRFSHHPPGIPVCTVMVLPVNPAVPTYGPCRYVLRFVA